MDFDAPRPWWPLGDLTQLREAAQHWIAKNWDTSITVGEWWDRLAGAGLAAPTWDRMHGGLAATTQMQLVFEEELGAVKAIAPPTVHPAIRLVGPALRQFATGTQVRQLLPRLLTGLDRWTVMMLDPGVDDPAATTACRAVFDWKYVGLEGEKACDDPLADRALVLARSSGEGRNGLTWVIVDFAGGETEEDDRVIEFHGYRGDPDQVLGIRDDGWAVTRTILPYVERSIAGRIRRGLVHVQPGSRAGNLHRTVADVLAEFQRALPPPVERRSR